MAKIVNPSQLNVGVELTIDTTAKTFTLNETGNLVYKDGVTLQALYSKFVQLWETTTYNKFPFGFYSIDALSGQFQIGTDGQTFSGWKPANDATRQALRDGGWSEFSSAGVLQRQYVGIVSLGDVNTGAQLYYQKSSGGTASNFTFTDEVNEGIQVYGDATNGNFDNRTYFKGYVREQGKKYKDSVLADTGKTATGAYIVNLLLSNEDDLKIQANDAVVSSTLPYTNIDVEYFATDQSRTIGGTAYPFRIIIDGANATAEQIYTKIQYLLRQGTDIDTGTGTVIGKTANLLLEFVGDTLITKTGVYIDNYNANDVNRLVFTDKNGVQRTEPFTATGTLNFNSFLTSGGTGYYRMYFTDLAGSNDYGNANAITVNNASGVGIFGTITGPSIPFSFAYDSNNQGSRTPGTDAQVTVVAGNAGFAKPVVTNYTITRATGQGISLVAENDRSYTA
jgi:hypothetical protein